MSIEKPILQQIHDEFDVYPKFPHTDHSIISRAEVESNENGYRIKTYPGGMGSDYDGFVIDVKAEGGLFGEKGPSRVETSRGYSSILMPLSPTTPTANEGKVSSIPAEEGLLLPGDKGFELFEELHEQIQTVRPILTDTLGLVQEDINPEKVSYKHTAEGNQYWDEKRKVVVVKAGTHLEVEDGENNQVNIALDATKEFPPNVLRDEASEVTVYRAGFATVKDGNSEQTQNLDILTLTAFSDVKKKFEELYRSSPDK